MSLFKMANRYSTVLFICVFGTANLTPLTLYSDENSENVKLNELITRFVKAEIPPTYSDNRKWNGQVRQYDGLKFRREGLKLETKRRWKMVNHGTWQKFSIGLVDPDKSIDVQVLNVKQKADGTINFDLQFQGHFWMQARQAKWVYDVQLYSISADAEANVTLTLNCDLNVDMDSRGTQRALVFSPKITHTTIAIDEFKVHRVSKLGGEFAQQVTKAMEDWIEEHRVEQEQKLVEKLNTQIEKKSGKLRLTVGKIVNNSFVQQFVPYLDKKIGQSFQFSTQSKSGK
jgi:hypothetical protein